MLTLTRLPSMPDDLPLIPIYSGRYVGEPYTEYTGSRAAYVSLGERWYQIGAPKPDRGPAQFVRAAHEGFEMQHRFEDLALIEEVIAEFMPSIAIELGTAEGGFTAFLASRFEAWTGTVVSYDKTPCPRGEALRDLFSNIELKTFDVIERPHPTIIRVLSRIAADTDGLGGVLLYCDNGNKMRELRLYAPHLAPGGLLGLHDWETEVVPDFAHALFAHYGYEPYRHEDFAALANVHYPTSLTRFWVRTEIIGQPDDFIWSLPS